MGLVGQLRSNANITQLLGYSVELYNTIEAETGLTEDETIMVAALERQNKEYRLEHEILKIQREDMIAILEQENEKLNEQLAILKNLEETHKSIAKSKKEQEEWSLGKYAGQAKEALGHYYSFAGGGYIWEDMMAQLHEGEFVLNADVVNEIRGATEAGGGPIGAPTGGRSTSYDYSNRSKATTNYFKNRITLKSGGLRRAIEDPIAGRREAEQIILWMRKLGELGGT